jgi:Fe-Mn family superoxide dismutase
MFAKGRSMPFALPDLPYAADAFGKIISAETFSFHHGKHHKAYVDKTNSLVEGTDLASASLVKVIGKSKANGDMPLFNNAAQIWNHSFYWQCLSPGSQAPTGRLADLIAQGFGTHDALLTKLKDAAVAHFGSGWAWLVLDNGVLKVTSLHDADSPAAHEGMAPLLTIDVWEHAYYIDYRNERPKHVQTLLESAINWEFVAQNLDGKGVSRADQG